MFNWVPVVQVFDSISATQLGWICMEHRRFVGKYIPYSLFWYTTAVSPCWQL